MTKQQLAIELRNRQREKGLVDEWQLEAISDNEMIDAYVTCSCCGDKQAEGTQLEKAINMAKDSDRFLRICSTISRSRGMHS